MSDGCFQDDGDFHMVPGFMLEDLDIIEKILRHLALWDIRNHDPPVTELVYIPELVYDYSDSQIPAVDYWS